MSAGSYLPDCWNDSTVMVALMSTIKDRAVNPVEWDRKVGFWRDLIGVSCVAERNALFSLAELKSRFVRGDMLPAGLPVVLDEMQNSRDCVPVSQWRDNHSDWTEWGRGRLGRAARWIFGQADPDDTRFVHVPTLQHQCNQLLTLYKEKLAPDMEPEHTVIEYSALYDCCRDIFSTEENFRYALDMLAERGELTMGTASNNDRIVKFKDARRRHEPVRLTATDTSLHDVRKTMGRIEKEISRLETKEKKLDEQTRASLREGQRGRAAMFLRQKKQVQKELQDKDGQYQRLLSILHQLASTDHTREVVEAYRTGTSAFRSAMERRGMSPDQVNATMDDIADSLEDARDVAEALAGAGIQSSATMDTEELEKELTELIQSDRRDDAVEAQLSSLPAPPRSPIRLSDEDSVVRTTTTTTTGERRERATVGATSTGGATGDNGTTESSLEARWKRLRASAH